MEVLLIILLVLVILLFAALFYISYKYFDLLHKLNDFEAIRASYNVLTDFLFIENMDSLFDEKDRQRLYYLCDSVDDEIQKYIDSLKKLR